MKNASRRDFLRTSGMLGIGLSLNPWLLAFQDSPEEEDTGPVTHWDQSPAGRILLNVMAVYKDPTWRAPHVGYYYYNNIVSVEGAATVPPFAVQSSELSVPINVSAVTSPLKVQTKTHDVFV